MPDAAETRDDCESIAVSAPQEAASFQTQDACWLKGCLVGDPAEAKMAVVLHPATGVPCRYYQPFAQWLAGTHQAVVLIYDYRDFGESRTLPIRQSNASMSDWGLLDQDTALTFMLNRFPSLPVRVIGHSLGGIWLAFHRSIARVDRVVAVASGPNYWLDQPWSYFPSVLWFWWLAGPLTTTFLGYAPGWLGLGVDLPKAVYWQWRRWCLSPNFSKPEWGKTLPEPRLDQARFHLTLLPIADDVVIPLVMARRLRAFYPHATISEDVIAPSEHGLKRIGHLRLFAPRSKAFWPRIAAPLVA